MRFEELLGEAPIAPGRQATATTNLAPGQEPGQEGKDIGKLTASVSALQKQVQDLQKAALQQAATQQAAPNPGEAGQAQQTKGPVGASQAGGTTDQKPAGAGQDAGMLDAIKKLAGLEKPDQPQKPAPKQMGMAQGVNQPPQITNLKIKQQLSKSQGSGTA